MATTKAKAIEKGDEPAVEAEPVLGPHDGSGHDWRNPDAKFDADDHCPNAEMRRLADANYR